MLTTIQNPRGVDYQVAKLQAWLQGILFPIWGLDPTVSAQNSSYVFYPRVHRNPDNASGFIAELYLGDGNYKEVYWDDTLFGLSFFGIGQSATHNGNQDMIKVHLVTFANLGKLYANVLHRADNEIRMDFQKVFEAPILGFQLESTEIGLANVLREYPGSRRDDRLAAADMGKIHAFRLNLSLNFNRAEQCDN